LGASYDELTDVLYLWRGSKSVEAISVPLDDGPIVRVQPETGALVGITLLDFSTCWANKERIELRIPVIARSEGDAPAPAAAAHRELVLA